VVEGWSCAGDGGGDVASLTEQSITARPALSLVLAAVNWSYYDDKMLSAFWGSNPERRALRALLPDMADRVLVFHRGITVAQASGLYTGEKVDLLVEYLVTKPLIKVGGGCRHGG
jgi:hypothetical protein